MGNGVGAVRAKITEAFDAARKDATKVSPQTIAISKKNAGEQLALLSAELAYESRRSELGDSRGDAYEIEIPHESAETLINQAMTALGFAKPPKVEGDATLMKDGPKKKSLWSRLKRGSVPI